MKTCWQTCFKCRKQFRGRYMAMECCSCKGAPSRSNAIYGGELGADKQWIERHEVTSSSLDRHYVVSLHRDGYWGCSCPVWKFRRLQCKHIEEVLNRKAAHAC
jgi:hypothetical protein